MNTRTDAQLLKEIQNEFLNNNVVKGSDIRVKVENGLVRLTGSVDRLYKKISAEALVVRVDGVIDVDNKISIRPWQFLKSYDYETSVSNFDMAGNKLTTSGA